VAARLCRRGPEDMAEQRDLGEAVSRVCPDGLGAPGPTHCGDCPDGQVAVVAGLPLGDDPRAGLRSLLMFAAPGPSRPGTRRSSASACNSRACTGRCPARPASSPCAACTPAAAGRDLAVTRPNRRGLTRHLTKPTHSRSRRLVTLPAARLHRRPPGWRWWIAGSAARGSGPGRPDRLGLPVSRGPGSAPGAADVTAPRAAPSPAGRPGPGCAGIAPVRGPPGR